MGYQCPECASDEYHLLASVQSLEVFDLEEDKPVEPGTPGRLLFTSLRRSGQSVIRYDVGDSGYLHTQPCACGRQDPKFTLLGRTGDVFKAGCPFLNYRLFGRYLEEAFGYTGLLQIILETAETGTHILLRIEQKAGMESDEVRSRLLHDYEALSLSVDILGGEFIVEAIPETAFDRVVRSGKIPHLIDRRK
jgi:phenylacetate-coenzyme A ligase PaaK-like adenylate-forming protein